MGNTIRRRKKSNSLYGVKEELKERRRQVFSHRCCGLSIRGIAEVMHLSKTQVQKDLNWAYKEWGNQPDNSREAIQAELVEVLRRAVALTMADAERQSREGVTIITTDGNDQNHFGALDQMAAPHDEINRIERELDQQAGKLKKDQPSGKTSKHQSLDAVVATSGLLVVVALAIVFGGRLNVTQRAALTGGFLGGAAGLLIGYGVGRIR